MSSHCDSQTLLVARKKYANQIGRASSGHVKRLLSVRTRSQSEKEETMQIDGYECSGTSPGKRTKPDFHLFSDGPNPPTVYLLTPYSKLACAWVAEHIPDDAMWFGSSIVIEHRYVAALVAQIERDGLVVSRG